MAHRLLRGLRETAKSLVLQRRSRPVYQLVESSLPRNYATDVRNAAYEGDVVLRLIRNEIQYELDHFPALEPVPEFNSFIVDGRPGEQWIQLRRKFGEKEQIKIEATMFNRLHMKKTDEMPEDMRLEITLVIDVFKGEDILEFVCSAKRDGIEIHKVYARGHDKVKDQSYIGPEFKDLDDDLQDSLYDFLEARGIDDELAEYLHLYIQNKEKNEYLQWMVNLKSFIQG
ncbi:uncharacterized protein At2g39795, mitochondrial-like [Andrographis paniculata]|uniref:uncharacterized protein At2g39795, mitochondrial-like n=1 Tax=Andrographis paniculata TaxID=175694 RepID=UPI0021E90573|nr:uncharacterized protein At2g39795, mitochondrial-like [Andrographis paniculata]XP_051136184.1 uncharacterized protein At2g39795, mitochondrial-like [Andrographis paniculata]XP_051136185.1 uncharacterized protein At2g39795, mitochondrial-like [Andrographis paniculata]XP_051136186.1 uncharacterized protein At2g39795, mitochondrial-like [Andrographis paniculata]